MSRRHKPAKRIPAPDPIYQSERVAKFINRIMLCGKKGTAEKILYGALELLDGKVEEKPLQVLMKALDKARPLVKVKARRVGGATYQVPMEVNDSDGEAIGSRWIIAYARSRNGRSMMEKLAAELLDTYRGNSATLKKRDEVHKMAEANKAFAHYRF
ncbi:MAG: 30S ribosomal protein S7 [Vampirovibrionales bacterium]|jgi:small subunit ribosomal protein S7|nr:30S ribosomal protein S7 [Vampirovibrionales bacterium]